MITALALIVGVVMIASPLAFIGGSDNADAPILGDASAANGTYTIFVYDGNYSGEGSGQLSGFVLGAYSPLTGANEFSMVYAEVGMY